MSLGELYEPLHKHHADPYPFYERARREEPLFYSPVIGAWVVTKMADVRRILRDDNRYSSANTLRPYSPFPPALLAELEKGFPNLGSYITMDGEEHRRLRAPAAAALSPERVAAAEPYITERASQLIDGFAKDGEVEFMAGYANRLPVDVIARLVGFAEEDAVAFGDDSRAAAAVGMGHRFSSEAEQVACAQAWVRFQRLIERYVLDRRAAPRNDLISDYLAAFAPGDRPLAFEEMAELVGLVLSVALPGHITTSALLGNGLLRLLSEPDQWRLLCERPDLAPNAAEEIARFDTPTHLFLRVSTTDTSVGGRDFPAGTEFALCLASANRDEDAFDRAETFDITRPPHANVVFGQGPHYCPGAGLARRQIEISLRLLAERLPGLRLVPGQRIEYRGTLDHRGPLALKLQW
ncbi:cytochrome P450 [Nonomuraea gerenzanensis]|uniref:Putative cytochrome P450 hydroxylase n=1 Tax=Nonomuraea gerenzanensis TaxID=93944 RepID=A0A1M4DVV6_9ACTN|nr:cytochrome P450 [Nonomuraea gerenzanensis]UBU13031.1 cytochrome P450 [Nonomuraea gerenzanensis]SBO90673.1 putative cytochrome P450 hydroxylase [Nonomuraea gerenzanensis]